MFKTFFVDRKIRKFIRRMTIDLPKRYGGREPFTEGQVKSTMQTLGYREEFEEIALLLFCDEETFKALNLDEALKKRYEGYRSYGGSGASYGSGESYGGFDGGGDGGGGD